MSMKQLLPVFLSVFSAFALLAETSPGYTNNAPMISPPDIAPQIDATRFVNRSIFEVNNYSGSLLNYDFQNTLYFENTGSGTMTFFPGVRFDYVNGSKRGFASS